MAKKKIDLSGVKEFMFNHGEKVALGTCLFLAFVFGGWGLLRAFTAGRADNGKPFAEAFKADANRIRSAIAAASKEELSKEDEEKIEKAGDTWKRYDSKFQPSRYVNISTSDQSKRSNPQVLAIKGDAGSLRTENTPVYGSAYLSRLNPNKPDAEMQLDYVRGLVYVHDVQANGLRCFAAGAGGAGGGAAAAGGNAGAAGGVFGLQPKGAAAIGMPQGGMQQGHSGPFDVVKVGQTRRMVFVHARFPMKEQMAEFARAMRMSSQKDMLVDNKDDLPRVIGIDVLKFEIVNKKKVKPSGELLFGIDPKTGKLTRAKALDELLRVAVYDEETPKGLEPYIHEGFCTPTPRLGNVRYPRFEFSGMNIAWAEEEKMEVAGDPKLDAKPKGGIGAGFGKLPGFKDAEKGPMGGEAMPGVIADRKVEVVKIPKVKELDPALAKRLFETGDFNIYHVLGKRRDPAAAAAPPKQGGGFGVPGGNVPAGGGDAKDRYFSMFDVQAGGAGGVPGGAPGVVAPPMGEGKAPPMGGVPGAVGDANFPDWNRDAVVRFIDPDVVPGSTYQYAIRVRMANPNYKKAALVAFARLADEEELIPSPWVETPSISIPYEYVYYAIDQHLLDKWADGAKAEKTPAPKNDPFLLKKDETTFQIHQFTEASSAGNRELIIGDWVVAERIVVRRGDAIGTQAMVKTPVWQKDKDAFEVPVQTFKEKVPGKKDLVNVTKVGFKMDFKPEAERPVLVDFVGGKRAKLAANVPEEETAVDALVLGPDGRLYVHNSRLAADHIQEYDPVDGKATTRQDRVLSARRRSDAILRTQGLEGGGGGNGEMPKLPGQK